MDASTALPNPRTLAPSLLPLAARARVRRSAVDAALRKAAILDRLDPRGDAYGAAGQALEDYVKREDQIIARGEDVTGWISIVTERRWINELRYQRRRSYDRLDAPVGRSSSSTLGDLTAARGPGPEDVFELRERLDEAATEQQVALAVLRAANVQQRHVRVVELALVSELRHHEIASVVNAEFAGYGAKNIRGNTITQIIGRQRERLIRHGGVPSVVARLRRTHHRPD